MKTIKFFINERFENNASNKEAMFLHKDGVRQSEGFTFNTGEKALLIKYDTDGYGIQIKSEKEDMTEFYHGLKFDKTGIAIVKQNSKYRGKSVKYWVLYNKELIDSDKDGKDIQEILTDKRNSWGFKLSGNEDRHKETIKDLKKYLKEFK